MTPRSKLIWFIWMLAAIALLVGLCLSAKGATWYVDNSASGNNSGTNWAEAFTNLASADLNAGFVGTGDTVYFAGHNYTNLGTVYLKGGATNNVNHYYFTNGLATVYCNFVLYDHTELNAGSVQGYETNF